VSLNSCFLFQYFQSLSVWGKVAVIAGYALMALLIILWEQSRVRRHAATRLPTVIPNSVIEQTEKFVHTSPTSTRKENQYKPHKRMWHLLETLRINFSKPIIYCESRTNGNDIAHHLQQRISTHISIIVNRLRRRVNESGKEPAGWFSINMVVASYPMLKLYYGRMAQKTSSTIYNWRGYWDDCRHISGS